MKPSKPSKQSKITAAAAQTLNAQAIALALALGFAAYVACVQLVRILAY